MFKIYAQIPSILYGKHMCWIKNRFASQFLLKGIAYILWIHLSPHAEQPIHLNILYACI